MWIVLAVPKTSLWVLRRRQLLTRWEIEFGPGKGKDHFWLWLQNNKGWKEKCRNTHPVMWVFPEVTPMDAFILVSLNLAFVCCLLFFSFFYCSLLAELLKAPEIVVSAYPYIYMSPSNLPSNCETCGSNSASFQWKPNFSWRKGWTVVLVFLRPLGNLLRKGTPNDQSSNPSKCYEIQLLSTPL